MKRAAPLAPAPPGLSDAGIRDALRMFAFAATHPRLSDGEPLTSAEIVALILDGVRTRDERDEED